MPKDEDWGLNLPDRFDTEVTDNEVDTDGPAIFERTCRGCGNQFLVSLYVQTRISPESPMCRCDGCIDRMIQVGKERVLRRCGPPPKFRGGK